MISTYVHMRCTVIVNCKTALITEQNKNKKTSYMGVRVRVRVRIRIRVRKRIGGSPQVFSYERQNNIIMRDDAKHFNPILNRSEQDQA